MEILQQYAIPAVRAAGVGPLHELQRAAHRLEEQIAALHHVPTLAERAEKARTLRLELMVDIRAIVDAAEAVVPAHMWTLATYKDLLFLDQTMP